MSDDFGPGSKHWYWYWYRNIEFNIIPMQCLILLISLILLKTDGQGRLRNLWLQRCLWQHGTEFNGKKVIVFGLLFEKKRCNKINIKLSQHQKRFNVSFKAPKVIRPQKTERDGIKRKVGKTFNLEWPYRAHIVYYKG